MQYTGYVASFYPSLLFINASTHYEKQKEKVAALSGGDFYAKIFPLFPMLKDIKFHENWLIYKKIHSKLNAILRHYWQYL